MTDDVLRIAGAIAQLPERDQARVKECAERLRKAITESGDAGLLALALVGAEAVQENE